LQFRAAAPSGSKACFTVGMPPGNAWKEPDYKVLFESAAGLYVVFDRELRIVAASDAYLRAKTTQREAILGKPLPEVFPALCPASETLERVFNEGVVERYGSVVSSPVRGADGTVQFVISSVEELPQALRESEQQYRTLFESIDAGFCVIEMIYDAQGNPVDYRFLEVNRAFEAQTGLEDATRKTMREHVPQHEQHWFDIYHRVATTGEPVRFVNQAKPLMGGWYEVYAYRVGGPGSRKVAVLFNDITERVRAVEALKEADRRKDEFLATLAHELRNPLAPIRNALTFMRIRGLPDPQLQHARELIERQIDQLVRLVDDLLDVSRITFGKIELHRERVELGALAQEAVATSRPLLDEAAHRLTVRIAREPLCVEGDPVRLLQVVSNLLNNAARYTPPGGDVLLEVEEAGGEALVSVKDNGVGIPVPMLDRVFDAFTQLHQSASSQRRDTSGIGIGLYLSRKLVELHGGRITAESSGLGQGSRFVVRLPLAEAASLAPAEKAQAAAADQPRRFLVVDDNADAAVSQAELLRMLGHEAETAYSGQEALRKAARFRPQVVLLDLGMPDMDGFEVARELRRMPEAKEATLIAQTGWSQADDRRRTAEAGFDAHLAKPVEVGALMETLARTARH
jgi:PAS domain S-box-containing protein